MTGSALNLAVTLVMHHDELVQHGVLRDARVEVWGTQILFHSIMLWKTTWYMHYLPKYQGEGA